MVHATLSSSVNEALSAGQPQSRMVTVLIKPASQGVANFYE